MDEREAEYLRQYIRDLEQSNRRWKAATFSLLVLLTLLMIPGALVFIGLSGRQARLQAEQAHREAERAAQQARQAEQAARPAPQSPAPAAGGPARARGADPAAGEGTRKAGAGGPSSPDGETAP